MDRLDHKPIYESPDGGKTVYVRFGNMKTKHPPEPGWIEEAMGALRIATEQKQKRDMWMEVINAAEHDPGIMALLEQARSLYMLSKDG